jgi:hypothetical protein
MGAAPFHETEVEAGFFAEELAGELEEPGFRLYRTPGFRSWAAGPSAGTTPNGSCSAPSCPGRPAPPGGLQPDPPASGPPVGEATSPAE